MRTLRPVLLAPVLALPVALLVAPPSSAADDAHVVGTVTDGTTPLPGIYVEVYAWDGDETTFVDTTTTGPGGTYDVGGLPAGTYRVKYADYVDDVYPEEWYDDAPTAALATDVVLAEDQVRTVDVALSPGGHLDGTVTDVDTDLPVQGIAVELNQQVGGEWTATATAFTDAAGAYRFDAQRPGTYRLGYLDYAGTTYVTEYYDDAPGVELADDLVVVAGQTTTADAALSRTSSVAGLVTGPTGDPLAGIGVALYDAGGAQVGNGATGSNGRFKLVDVVPGTYRVGFGDTSGVHLPEYWSDAPTLAAADPVVVGVKQAVSGVDADLALAPVPVEVVTRPVIGGSPRVGALVTVSRGTWDPADVDLTYAWRAGGIAIAGATSASYRVGAGVRGKALTVAVTASAPGSLPTTVVTAASPPVAPGSLAPCGARLVKPARVTPGSSLTVRVQGCADARRAVQWYAGKRPVAGARGHALTLRPRAGEVGSRLSVVVSATRTGYVPVVRTLVAGVVKPRSR